MTPLRALLTLTTGFDPYGLYPYNHISCGKIAFYLKELDGTGDGFGGSLNVNRVVYLDGSLPRKGDIDKSPLQSGDSVRCGSCGYPLWGQYFFRRYIGERFE